MIFCLSSHFSFLFLLPHYSLGLIYCIFHHSLPTWRALVNNHWLQQALCQCRHLNDAMLHSCLEVKGGSRTQKRLSNFSQFLMLPCCRPFVLYKKDSRVQFGLAYRYGEAEQLQGKHNNNRVRHSGLPIHSPANYVFLDQRRRKK